MVSKKEKESDDNSKYHPIVYFLVILLQQDNDKNSNCYKSLKKYLEKYNIKISNENDIEQIQYGVNNIKIKGKDESNDVNKNSKSTNSTLRKDIVDVIYDCIDEYGQRTVNMARIATIKNYYSKTPITNQIILNIFVILNLGNFVYCEKEWYKFSKSRNGWELISIYDLAKEINLSLVNNLYELCKLYNISLEGLTNNLNTFINNHAVSHNHLESLETFFLF